MNCVRQPRQPGILFIASCLDCYLVNGPPRVTCSGFVLQQPQHVILGNDLLQLFPRITSCFPGCFDGDCKYSMHILIIYHYTIPNTSTKNLYTLKKKCSSIFTFRKVFQTSEKVMPTWALLLHDHAISVATSSNDTVALRRAARVGHRRNPDRQLSSTRR